MDRLRTFGIVAHIDAGKTTLTERILFDAGARDHCGSVDDGTAATDWLPEERSRGISIEAAATRVAWAGHELQIVDTPGHVDFVAEVERSLHVLDGVVVVVDAVRGVESQTRAVWAQAAERVLPRIVFVNKLDRVGAGFATVIAEVTEVFEVAVAPVVVPLTDAAGAFAGLGDAASGAVQWFAGEPTDSDRAAIARTLRAAHDRLLELAADLDEQVLAAVVGGRPVPPPRLLQALRPAFLAGRLVPAFAGAALWNQGVDWLLDGVVAWLPGLSERPRNGLWAAHGAGDPDAPFAGIVFKVDHRAEVWNYVRVVRGTLVAGAHVHRVRGAQAVAVGELWIMQADRHQSAQVARPGEIVVLPGELGLRTGDTLAVPGTMQSLPVPRFPAPVLAATFEPAEAVDAPRLLAALRQLAADDPTLRVDRESDQIVVRGMGELHLEVVAERAAARAGVRFQVARPRVDRRVAPRRAADSSGEVRATVAGSESWARCTLSIRPLPGEPGPARIGIGSAVAASVWAEAARTQLRELAEHGMATGAMVAAALEVSALACSDPASEALVQIAVARAFEAAVAAAGALELEPWVSLEIWTPEDALQPVLADLGARRAVVQSVAAGRLGARIEGRAPLARMLGYVTRLRSITKGLGRASMRPAGLAPNGSANGADGAG